MNTNLVNYYTELVKFSSDGRESRRVSELDRLYRRLSECRAASLAESDDCRHDCPARRLLEDITVLDWLRAIDNRWEVILCLVTSHIAMWRTFSGSSSTF